MRFSHVRAVALLALVCLAAANASCAGSEAVLSRIVANPSPTPSVLPSTSPSPMPSTSPSPTPSPSPTGSPLPSPSPSPQLIGANLFVPAENPTTDPNYGVVLGYFKSDGTINVNSQVVTVPAHAVVHFEGFDTFGIQHTVSFLGAATAHSAPWPSVFNGSSTQSPAGTVINAPMFSSGPLDHNIVSPAYLTPPPGFYMFGCAFHYDGSGMRTVIISI